MATRLECTEGGHNKFWTIEIENEDQTVVKYGKIGDTARESTQDHGSADAAVKFMNKMIAQKKKKGYKVVESPASTDEVKEPASKKPKTDSDSAFKRFELTSGGHNKFWQIKVCGSSTVVEYGAIGAKARESKKDWPAPDKAEKFAASQIGKKKKEGYVSVDGGSSAGGGTGAGTDPKLYLFGSPCTAFELEKRRDDWDGPDGEFDLCSKDVTHGTMDDAPAVAKDIAKAMNDAMPGLEDIYIVKSSEGSDGGEVIVVGSPGPDPKKGILKALGILEANFGAAEKAATLENKDWSKWTKDGFNIDPDDEFDAEGEFEDDEDLWNEYRQVVAGTKLMAEKLTKHFMFNFKESFAVAPVIYGGYAPDGSIVGVLSSRVWT